VRNALFLLGHPVGKQPHMSPNKKQKILYETVGKRIRDTRKIAKLTQEGLATRVNLTRTSVTNIEKGRQKLLLHTLFELATAMKVPVAQLMPDQREEQPQFEQKLTNGLSVAEKKWIVGEISKPSKTKVL
jgi:transcriptional regulator with XRE-family HTH domain